MIHNQEYYDYYDRSKAKVYLGEYAAHLPVRPNNVETALAEALYLTAVERNGDVGDVYKRQGLCSMPVEPISSTMRMPMTTLQI